eukprot:TRINITY_DN5568_c0_g1_i1.p1 TRINITY_DN5568_c0_g1~~TRINITY_DN5568_c0_g1_i1.p1  ORF type:complete len:384 (+),score=75.08 TRINITY_DN5568_c0_g1_i1:81-1232(+)
MVAIVAERQPRPSAGALPPGGAWPLRTPAALDGEAAVPDPDPPEPLQLPPPPCRAPPPGAVELKSLRPDSSDRASSPPAPQPHRSSGRVVAKPLGSVVVPAVFAGHLVFGPDRAMSLLSGALIVIPTVLFVVFVYVHPALAAIGGGLAGAACTALFAAGSTDPGIILKEEPPPEPPPSSHDQRVFCVLPDGRQVEQRQKWCHTCHIWRPERTSHCSECGNCVLRFDHHCPWTGTCVGARNYMWFVIFLASTTLLAVHVCVVSLVAVVRDTRKHDRGGGFERFVAGAGESHYFAPLLVVYTISILCCVGGLFTYHAKLVVANKTTHEDMKYIRGKSQYDRGTWYNIREVFFERPRSRVLDFVREQRATRRSAAAPDARTERHCA